MALSKQVIEANELLKALTPEQISAIVTLSLNDENDVIGRKLGEIHGQYEADFLAASGITKNSGEKAYEYGKRIITSLKDKLKGLENSSEKIQSLEREKQELETKLKSNAGDAQLKKDLDDIKAELKAQKDLYKTEKENWEKTKGTLERSVLVTKVENDIEKSISGLSFKKEIPQSVLDTFISNARESILNGYTPEYIETEGSKQLIFRDEKGEIVRNPANALHPFTAKELMQTKLKDIIAEGEGGTGKKLEGGKTKVTLDGLSGAKTKIKANEIIDTYLMAEGLTQGSEEFQEKKNQLWKENNVDKLPTTD